MKIGDKVKCIDNSNNKLATKYLVVGKIYTITNVYLTEIFIDGANSSWKKSRFILSTNDIDTLPAIKISSSVAPVKEAACGVCSRMNDVGVRSCWNCGNKP